MKVRTANEIEADRFDLDLHRLWLRAERLAKDCREKRQRHTWRTAADRLRLVRSYDVRPMMHADDRKETE